MQSFQIKFVQAVKICLILTCFAIWVPGQEIASDKLALSRYDKRIDEGKFSEVETELLNYVIANPKDAVGFALMAKLRLKQGRVNEAKSLSLKALTLNHNLLSAKLSLASAHFQVGETQQSRAVLDSISGSEHFDDSLGLSLAETYFLLGYCSRALKTAEELSVRIRDSEALPIRAACYLESGDEKSLDALILAAKKLAKQNPTVAIKFAEVLSKAARHKETTEILRLVIAASPKNPAALVLLARSEISLKDYPNAKIHLEQAETNQLVSADVLFVRSILEKDLGNIVQSMALLERSLAEDPNNTDALGQLAVTAMRANQSGKAVRAAEKLIALKPENLEALYLYGAASLQNNNLQNAENALGKFLAARPDDSRGCLALGLTFAGQPDKLSIARQRLEKCLTINPANYEAAYQLGLSYKALGETAKAIEYLELTVKLSPDYALALRDLGAVYLQAGGEGKARLVLERAVELNPNDADTHFQLSRLYNLLGASELAKKHLQIFQDLKKPKNGTM